MKVDRNDSVRGWRSTVSSAVDRDNTVARLDQRPQIPRPRGARMNDAAVYEYDSVSRAALDGGKLDRRICDVVHSAGKVLAGGPDAQNREHQRGESGLHLKDLHMPTAAAEKRARRDSNPRPRD